MSIFVIGVNHKTASLTIREKVYFTLDSLPLYLNDLLTAGLVQEAVLLSTCNRSELYCETNEIEAVKDWFCAQTSLPRDELEKALYVYKNEDAVAHMMEVACGLDSLVLGEPQILGQMKAAFSESCSAGAVGALFHQLFQQIFTMAKEIRTTTAIGACPVSVASAAVHFAKQQTPSLEKANIVLIGAGDTAALLIRYLKSHGARSLILVNRNVEKAEVLMEGMNGKVYGLNELADVLPQADIVFSAAASPAPIINKAMVSKAMQERFDRPLMLIDIAVPRNIAEEAAELAHVKLFCIDDLKMIIEKNRQGREHAGDKAREMIHQKSITFMAESHSIDKVAHTIRAYRGQIEAMCKAELLKARHQLRQGSDPQKVLDTFAHAFTNKLLHAPSVQLRQAGVEGRLELLSFAKQLFALPDTESL